jgi:uncharacterized protein (DUF4415 family)
MIFVWDEKKNRSNRRKHGISFEAAARIFDDPNVVSYPDRVVNEEERTQVRNKMAKKKSVSSRQEKRVPASALFTTPISDKQRRELKRLAARPDSQIDFSDAPERQPRASDIQVGRFYRPIKQLVSLRVDADVLHWFRGRGKKYQTYMNEVLRREMQSNERGQ